MLRTGLKSDCLIQKLGSVLEHGTFCQVLMLDRSQVLGQTEFSVPGLIPSVFGEFTGALIVMP